MLKLIVVRIQEDHDFFDWKIIWSDKDMKEKLQLPVKTEKL